MSGIDLTIENLTTELNDLEQEISQKRKKGLVRIGESSFQKPPTKKKFIALWFRRTLMLKVQLYKSSLKHFETISIVPE